MWHVVLPDGTVYNVYDSKEDAVYVANQLRNANIHRIITVMYVD